MPPSHKQTKNESEGARAQPALLLLRAPVEEKQPSMLGAAEAGRLRTTDSEQRGTKQEETMTNRKERDMRLEAATKRTDDLEQRTALQLANLKFIHDEAARRARGEAFIAKHPKKGGR